MLEHDDRKLTARQCFVPVSSNWDLNMDGGCAPRRRRNADADTCRNVRCDNKCNADANDGRCTRRDDKCNADADACRSARREDKCSTECCDNAAEARRCAKQGRHVGMIDGTMQEICDLYQSDSALRAGTLFPELHKPLDGYCPYDANCGTCAQAAAFAAWELRLYLNTHPDDKEALRIFRELCEETETKNYATAFLPGECLTGCWSWVSDPWPWEYDCQCGI